MIQEYYQSELQHLRELAAEFARLHPALAPMLSEGSADPDVERLLEGSAFLSGLIAEKLDDDFPEIVHGLMQLIFPHYLRPIPSTTILRFTPKRGLREVVRIPVGTRIDSVPVDGTACGFSTCYEVDLSPLELSRAVFESDDTGARVRLEFRLLGVNLSLWRPKSIRLHLSGPYPEAAARRHLLMDGLRSVRIRPRGSGAERVLSASALTPVGFEREHRLLPYPTNSFPGYRILQEYFILPEKFLFLDLDLSDWTATADGDSFEIVLDLGRGPSKPPALAAEHIVLHATPAINLFPSNADPIMLDHRRPEYTIRPSGANPEHFQVYSVRQVIGFRQGTVEQRRYEPFEMFNPQAEAVPVYTVRSRRSPLSGRSEMTLSVAYPGSEKSPAVETLSLDILCTNAELPASLDLGDVSRPTESSPELATFANIRKPTEPVQPPLGKNALWRLLSHLYLSQRSLADVSSLREILKLYIFSETRDRAMVLASTRRVEALRELKSASTRRIIRGEMLRGREIAITVDPTGFTGPGDIHVFGSVLDYFLATYAAINCFTRLSMTDTLGKELRQWPERLGEQPLL